MSRLYCGLPVAPATVVAYCGVPDVALIICVPLTNAPRVLRLTVEVVIVCAAPLFQVNVSVTVPDGGEPVPAVVVVRAYET